MARKPSDDNETRMTLGEHLEELRWRMIYALIGLAIGTTLSLIFANSLIGLLRLPYVNAMKDAGLEPDLTVLDVTGAFAMYLKVALISGLVLSSPWVFYQM